MKILRAIASPGVAPWWIVYERRQTQPAAAPANEGDVPDANRLGPCWLNMRASPLDTRGRETGRWSARTLPTTAIKSQALQTFVNYVSALTRANNEIGVCNIQKWCATSNCLTTAAHSITLFLQKKFDAIFVGALRTPYKNRYFSS